MLPNPRAARRHRHQPLVALALAALLPAATPAQAPASDPRVGLTAGWKDAGEAIKGLELVAHRDRPEGFYNAQRLGDFRYVNSDLAFKGSLVFQGGYNGIQVWDIATPATPVLKAAFACPGGQGDVSVLGNLLFMSVEEYSGRVDCGAQGVKDSVSTERFIGVRIFDIGDVTAPRPVAAVQTCRGSHTHTLVTKPGVTDKAWVYVSGTSPSRSPSELAGCSRKGPAEDPNTSYFRIDVIEVPLANPAAARVGAGPRIFADSTGKLDGLWKGGTHGPNTQETSDTDQCHDITAYPALGIAAGACSGNGILLDITDPANPTRLAEVIDPNFAYWHSATFNNAGTAILFSDEWGGGVAPRCRSTDRLEWGADAIFRLDAQARKLTHAGYFKIPAAQTAQENCVAHNGSLIPVPGRDIMVQSWYQGGISVFDFTDPAKPVEIAYFDRGPVDARRPVLAGFWSAYWYNGLIVGSEIARGLDVFRLLPSEHLTRNEIDAAALVQVGTLNPQHQDRLEWPAAFVVARAYLDQLVRGQGLPKARTTAIGAALASAERASGAARAAQLRTLAAALDRDARAAKDAARVRAMADVVRRLAAG
ncbi:MAG: LVIVD repeat-containing protein [Gemmatimonadota bacterium]